MHVSASLLASLRQFPIPNRYVVAYSGGCDSHVLLHALMEMRARSAEMNRSAEVNSPAEINNSAQANRLGKENRFAEVNILAVHINHGLQADADKWQQHCKNICRELKVNFESIKLNLAIPKGESLEAYAREARYAAIRTVMQADDMLLLAQHADDQAETVLLQALRGSGVKGLAAMPKIVRNETTWQARPMLSISRKQIDDYANQHALNWIDDPSNKEIRFDRNFLRHQIIPDLKQRWPAMAETLSRVALHQADADQLMTELAELDWCICKVRNSDNPNGLSSIAMTRLSQARQRNLLRYWIAQCCESPLPDAATCQRILDEVIAAAEDAEPELCWANVVVRRYRGVLYLEQQQSSYSSWQQPWDLTTPLLLPCGKKLHVRTTLGQGLIYKDTDKPLSVRYRLGGEKCQLPGRAHRHELKKLFQTWGIPPWQRDRVPLIYVGEDVAQVVGYSVCESFIAQPGQVGYEIYIND